MKALISLLSLAVLGLGSANSLAQSSTITTYAGPALPVGGSQAVTQTIGVPQGISTDGAGGFYVASSSQDRIYRVAANGTLTVVAGNGLSGFGGDGGPGPSAQLNYVHCIALDNSGNLYIADTNNNRIRKVTTAGIITTIAGSGGWGFRGDGGPATSAQLAAPRGVAVDPAGNIFIADSGNDVIRMVTTDGIINTVAGNGSRGFSGDNGPATSAQLSYPVGVAVDANGNLFIADRYNNRIRMVNSSGVITTLIGAPISDPRSVSVDNSGNVFVSDSGNNRVRMISPGGALTTVAGGAAGFSGDGGPATAARLALPIQVAADGIGNIFIADRGNYRVRRVTANGIIDTVAGTSDDGRPASQAQLNFPNVIAVDGSGNLFIADTDSQRIRMISRDGIISTIAGNGSWGFSGDGGAAISAQLNYPASIAVDAAGNLFITDTNNHRIRKISPNGIITTVVGNGRQGSGGDGGPASRAAMNYPRGIAVDGTGNLYIADTDNQRIRKVDSSGIITTLAGNGTSGFSGDGGPATDAQLAFPVGLTIDGAGNLFIADSVNNRIRKVTPDGIVTTAAGSGMYGFRGDGGPALSASLAYPNGVAVDAAGNLFIADTSNQRVRKVTPDGVITTLSGNGTFGFAGDGGAPSSAQLAYPYSVVVDASNNIFIDDTFSNRIRKIASAAAPPPPPPPPPSPPPPNSFSITDRGGISLTSVGTSSSTQTGYGRVQLSAGSATPAGLAVFSYRSGSTLVSETSVSATNTLKSGRIYAEVNGPANTGLAIANPNNQTATINFFFTDAGGNDLGSGTTTIGANQQIAKFLDSDPFKKFVGAAFQGTFSFTSDVPVGVVAIRGLINERNEFLMSTLPVIDTTLAPSPGTAVVPHFSDGGGWTTQILLVNPNSTALIGTVEFHDDSGSLTNVTIEGQNKNTFVYTVPPRSSEKFATTGAAPKNTSGSVRIIPTDGQAAPIPLVIFSYRPAGITVTEAGVPSISGNTLRVYVESAGPIQSGIAVANNSQMPASVTFELTNLDGSTNGLPAPISATLAGFGHTAQFLSQMFPGLPASFKGILRVSTASSGISVVGLRSRYNERNDFLITTTPPANEATPSSSGELVLPHLADGGGYSTEFIFFSTTSTGGGGSSSGSLLLFNGSGQSLSLTLR
jgi:sugar lactone lactonase YvrE